MGLDRNTLQFVSHSLGQGFSVWSGHADFFDSLEKVLKCVKSTWGLDVVQVKDLPQCSFQHM